MNTQPLEEARERLRPYVEKAKSLSGWDFSPIRILRLPPDHPWDYLRYARDLVSRATAVLDIGTGGGERFSEICAGFDGLAVATEGWPFNVPVAAARLRPLSIELVYCEDEVLPFTSESFGVIVNRHAAWNPADISRLLTPRGIFFTQQVDSASWKELCPFFPGRQYDWGHTFERDVEGLRSAGLQIIEARQNESFVAYQELGDLVMNLIRTPWEVQDFDPLGADLEALLALEAAQSTSDGVVLTEARSVIEARKPS